MNRLVLAFLVLSLLSLGGPGSLAQAAQVGVQAPAFLLKDTGGRTRSLGEAHGKYLVLEWLNFDCPFVRKHYRSGNMQALQKKYTGRGVLWYSVVSSAPGKQGAYPASELDRLNRNHGGGQTAILIDATGEVGRAYAAKTTPHMYVIDPRGKLIYEGAIDDKPTANPRDIVGARNFVADALEQSMSGKPVSTSTVPPYGCGVKYPE